MGGDRRVRRDGGRSWIQADAVPLLGDDGAVREIICSFVDVTEHQQKAATTLAQERRLALLYDATTARAASNSGIRRLRA